MSFQDIESGLARPGQSNSISNEDSAFFAAQSSLSLQVFKINSNVQGILKLVDQLGTAKDSAVLRKSLHDLTETTRDLAKRSSEDLKKLASMAASSPRHKTSLQKTSHDLQLSLVAFQKAQQVSAERQRTVVEGVKIAVEDEHEHRDDSAASPQQRQAQLMHSQLSPHELAYQESLIQEREAEIEEIESGIHELAEIFRDLGTLVNQQGGMLDNIESNVFSIAADTRGAAEELSTASEYQRKAGRRAACLMIILVIVVAVVLLAVRVFEIPLLHADSTDLCVDFVISRCGVAVLDSLLLIIVIIYRIFNDHLTDIRRITASHSSTPIVRERMSEENTSIDLIRVYLVSHQKRSIEYTSLVGTRETASYIVHRPCIHNIHIH
ncbi:t-SNARE [Rhizopogon salebrosus TDB-379]|nr:t-SNARE [Rhizopogon salebrosus TDB-379]